MILYISPYIVRFLIRSKLYFPSVPTEEVLVHSVITEEHQDSRVLPDFGVAREHVRVFDKATLRLLLLVMHKSS
jgi:hypothetical protein